MKSRIAVIGLGGMGSMAAASAATRGASVVGFDLGRPPHTLGSTHGGSRVARTAYFEHPDYVPLLREAMGLWTRLERDAGRTCLHRCGVLLLGDDRSEVLAASRRSADLHGIRVEDLPPGDLTRRWPAFRLPADVRGLLEPDSGFVVPEVGVEAGLAVARARGAELHFETRVRSVEADDDGARILTEDGSRWEVDRVILTAGAWMRTFLTEGGLPDLFEPRRQHIVWSVPSAGHAASLASDVMPAWLYDDGGAFGDGVYYGVPTWPGQIGPAGVKIGFHGPGTPIDPDGEDRAPDPRLVARFGRDVDSFLPGVLQPPHAAATCLYTMSPDRHFIVDRAPTAESVIVLGGFSGHGYKFAPLMGEIAADLALEGRTGRPIGFLRFGDRRHGVA